ncbi:MAG: hypothetical protein DDT40_01131 [candidate division WS2 bacterium]|nr:hypothetical protein [Candidatus Psychracetigena formicireducens]
MTVNLANKARITFSKPSLGIIRHLGWCTEISAGDIAIPKTGYNIIVGGDIGAVEQGAITTAKESRVKNLRYEPNQKCLLLDLDIDFKNMGGIEGALIGAFTSEDGVSGGSCTGGNFRIVTLQDFATKVLSQENINAVNFLVTSSANFGVNQGFLFWWNKYINKNIKNTNWSITLLQGAVDRIIIEFQPNKKIIVSRIWTYRSSDFPPTPKTETEKWEVELPAGYKNSEFGFDYMHLEFVGEFMLLSMTGKKDPVALKCKNFDFARDRNGRSFPVLSRARASLQLKASGAWGAIGLSRLFYMRSGQYISDWFMPQGGISGNVTGVFLKAFCPVGTGFGGVNFPGGGFGNILVEGLSTGRPSGRLRYGFSFLSPSGQNTPWFSLMRLQEPRARRTADGTATILENDILRFSQSTSVNKDGSFGDDRTTLDITCLRGVYNTLFSKRNSQVRIEISPGTNIYSTLATHYTTHNRMSRPSHDTFTLSIDSESIIKRLRLTPILRAESFDARGWRHTDLIKYLIQDLGGITFIGDDDQTSPVLAGSPFESRPNWAFNIGASLWECIEIVRKYSGWCLYPTVDGRIRYKPMPTVTSRVDYTLNIPARCVGIEYDITDTWRTRFYVRGVAAWGDTLGKYKEGDGIMAYKTNDVLEEIIGETRMAWIFEPAYSNIATVKNACNKLYDWYSGIHKFIHLKIENAHEYINVSVFDVFNVIDNEVPAINGRYIVIQKTWDMDLVRRDLFLDLMSL